MRFKRISVVFLLAFSVAGYSQTAINTRVLYISSSNSGERALAVSKSFVENWKRFGQKVSLLTYLYQTNEFPPDAESFQSTILSLQSRLKELPPKLILSHGNDALTLSSAYRDRYHPGIPIIAMEITENQWLKFRDRANLYRIEMPRLDLSNISLARHLFPKLSTIYLLMKETTTEDERIRYEKELATLYPGTSIQLVFNPTFRQVDPLLTHADKNSLVMIFTPGLQLEDGSYLSGKELIRYLRRRYRLPVIEFFREDMGTGLLGGVGFIASSWGGASAILARELLIEGKTVPVSRKPDGLGSVFIDYQELVDAGGDPRLIPEGAEILNSPPPFWERYRLQLQLIAALMSFLIVFLLTLLYTRRRQRVFLLQHNQKLESQVAARTHELETANEELTAVNSNLLATMRRMDIMQEQLMQHEREAVLGRLTAGIAHELNSPLNAIRSANETVRVLLSGDKGSFAVQLLSLDETQKKRFLQLQDFVVSKDFLQGGNAAGKTSAEIETFRRRVADIGLGIDEGTATDLVYAGLSDIDDNRLSVLAQDTGGRLSTAMTNFANLERSIQIVDAAVDRSEMALRAIREYVTIYKDEIIQNMVGVESTLEKALLLLKNKWPSNIALIKSYETVPDVFAAEVLLIRVWVHLIQNALQAMRNGGRLIVRLNQEGDDVAVSFDDEGEGIDLAIEATLFNPFVTTKPYAEGLGLGLAYCRKIVTAIGGSISYKRKETGTIFIVRIKKGVLT